MGKIQNRDLNMNMDMRNEVGYIKPADVFIFLSLILEVVLVFAQLVSGATESVNKALFFNAYILLFCILYYFLSVGINRHFLIFAFYACFFIFLMGQKPFRYEYGYDVFHTFTAIKLTPDQYLIFTNLIYSSLITTFLGYRSVYGYFKKKKYKREAETKENWSANEQFFTQYRWIVRVLFIFSFLCTLINTVETLIAKSQVSYEEGYLLNVQHNVIISFGSYLFAGSFFMYLSARPGRREIFAVMFAYLFVNGILQLFIGGRIEFAKVVLFIIWYTICYMKFDRKKMPNRFILYLGVLGVIMMTLFWFVQNMRGNNGAQFDLLASLKEFLISTGGSDSVIANTIDKADEFPKSGILYFIAPIKDNIRHILASVAAIFTGESVPDYAQGLEYLQHNDTFSHWISYIVNPDMYCNGHGMGSSYIAETYLAFGVFGVMLCGVIIGVMLARLSIRDIKSTSVFKNAIAMYFISFVFTLPRTGFFDAFYGFILVLCTMLLVKCILFVMGQKARRVCCKQAEINKNLGEVKC